MKSLPRRIAADTHYNLVGLPTSIASFSLTIAGIAAGVGSLVAVVGLPVLAGTGAMARTFADHERAALTEVVDQPLERPHYAAAPAGAGWFRRALNPLASGQTWMDLLHAIVTFPLSLVSFVLTVVWWAGAIAGLTFPLYGWILYRIPDFHSSLPELLGLGSDLTTYVVFNTALGVAFAVTLPVVVRLAALTRASMAQILLTRPAYAPRLYAAAA
ncbi:sensor domain-containing protein [Nonomuraea sp. NPDC050556]|uniref:sensor domain-containing protein n=1 Tax=Nonomuraea sp. NPDC050556 TaxID=3364369 RepID=UPI0037A7F474